MLLSAFLLQLVATTPNAVPSTTVANVPPSSARVPRVAERAPTFGPSRVETAPEIDGRDDDASWKTVAAITSFRQFEPTEDGEPTLRTEARIAYDAHNLYIVVRSFDPKPDSILSVLQRRDAQLLSDDIVVGIDSYNDKRTGYMFRLTAAGAMADGYVFNDGEEDWGWNAVWQGAARVD